MQIRRIMNRIADPTDRPFNSTSSPDNSYAIKDTHAAAASGDQAYITVRNLYVRWPMHMDYYPVVGWLLGGPRGEPEEHRGSGDGLI